MSEGILEELRYRGSHFQRLFFKQVAILVADREDQRLDLNGKIVVTGAEIIFLGLIQPDAHLVVLKEQNAPVFALVHILSRPEEGELVAAGVAKVVGSVALSTAVSAGLGYLENGKQGAIDGAANGFMFASLSVAGGAAVKYAKAAKAARAGLNAKPGFVSEEKLLSHYEKHGEEFKGLYRSPDEYLTGAQDVMKNGYKVEYIYKGEARTGFVQFMGNNTKGNAKFAFVGTNNDGYITTFHTESGKSFWKMLNGNNIPVINPK